MNADALSPPSLPFNPDILRWAREWRGRSVAEAAHKAGVSEEKLFSWERGETVPTVRQGRVLAGFYDRPFLEFFLSRRPNVAESDLVPDFRLHRDHPDPKGDRELKVIQAWAEDIRLNALDLFALVGEQPPSLPNGFHATLDTNPERAANEARAHSTFSAENQIALKGAERGKVSKLLRRSIEEMGVLVLKESAIGRYGVRGMTVFATPLPIVVFGAEAPTAQAFTMAHELGHIMLQQSAISGPPSASDARNEIERAERWCDEFAGAFLVPADSMTKVWAKPNVPVAQIGDQLLGQLANTFSVSRHAMLIRLVQLSYVEKRFYWEIMRPKFLQQEAEFKGGGRSLYYGSRFRGSVGDMYTGLVLDAWGNGRITNHNAAELMGTKSLRHLFDIRDHFTQ